MSLSFRRLQAKFLYWCQKRDYRQPVSSSDSRVPAPVLAWQVSGTGRSLKGPGRSARGRVGVLPRVAKSMQAGWPPCRKSGCESLRRLPSLNDWHINHLHKGAS